MTPPPVRWWWTGTGFLSKSGGANDIVASKLTSPAKAAPIPDRYRERGKSPRAPRHRHLDAAKGRTQPDHQQERHASTTAAIRGRASYSAAAGMVALSMRCRSC